MNTVDCSQRENDREKGRERGNQLERGGSWSIMVSHSRMAEKGKAERQSDTENKTDKHNGRSFKEKLPRRK